MTPRPDRPARSAGRAPPPSAYRAPPQPRPLDLGDHAHPPGGQTYWVFPTKKETLSSHWTDPVKRINDPAGAHDRRA